MHSFSTADLLDEYPESIVLMENFLSYGEVSTFLVGQRQSMLRRTIL